MLYISNELMMVWMAFVQAFAFHIHNTSSDVESILL